MKLVDLTIIAHYLTVITENSPISIISASHSPVLPSGENFTVHFFFSKIILETITIHVLPLDKYMKHT